MKEFYVYKHTAPTGKVYIGITCTSPSHRWHGDGSGYRGQSRFWNAIQKYGWDNFQHEILFSGLSVEEASRLEVALIRAYDSTNPDRGYNVSSGGFGGNLDCEFSEERRRKISEAAKGRVFTEEHRKRLSEAHLGQRGNNLGHLFSAEHRDHISKSKTGINNPRKRAVRCVETGEIFTLVKYAADAVGCKSPTHISGACLGKRKTVAGYHWEYVD